jgi:hypothetical protein
VALSARAKLTVRVVRAGKRRRTVKLGAATRPSVRLAARGLRAGRYRLELVATNAAGQRSKVKRLMLVVRR